MRLAVQLDDERPLDAAEVGDERPNRMLSAKSEIAELPRTQMAP
jgi:hypothetical protein